MTITHFGSPDRPGGGRPGAADQSALLRALKLQTVQKVYLASSGKNAINTRLHTNSVLNRLVVNANQQAIQRSIFYRPV